MKEELNIMDNANLKSLLMGTSFNRNVRVGCYSSGKTTKRLRFIIEDKTLIAKFPNKVICTRLANDIWSLQPSDFGTYSFSKASHQEGYSIDFSGDIAETKLGVFGLTITESVWVDDRLLVRIPAIVNPLQRQGMNLKPRKKVIISNRKQISPSEIKEVLNKIVEIEKYTGYKLTKEDDRWVFTARID